MARIVAALLAFLTLRFFFFWLAAGLVFQQQPDHAGFVADVLALACAALILRFWPGKQRPSAPRPGPGSGPAFKSRILLCSTIAGTIGFAGGFFGPMVFSPQSNQGPLLGFVVTGPAGFLLGPVIGVASLIGETSLADLRKATLWLALEGVLAGVFFALLWMFAVVGLGLMLITIAVGAALFVHTVLRLAPPKPVVASGAILLAGAVLMLGLSLFPPVVAPWWGVGPDAGEPLPAFAFIFDPGFDTSRHVPRYAIDRPLWALEMLAVAALVAIGLLLVRIAARTGPGPGGGRPAS